MKKFVRGGILLTVLSLCVVFIYAQSNQMEILSSANDSQQIFENTDSETVLTPEIAAEIQLAQQQENAQDKKAKSTVKKTVSSRPTSAGTYTATAYCLRGRTALGHSVRKGMIAADPKVLKLGSTVSLSAGKHSGEYLVSDTGGRIRGRKIDIWMASCAEARKFGRRTVQIAPL